MTCAYEGNSFTTAFGNAIDGMYITWTATDLAADCTVTPGTSVLQADIVAKMYSVTEMKASTTWDDPTNLKAEFYVLWQNPVDNWDTFTDDGTTITTSSTVFDNSDIAFDGFLVELVPNHTSPNLEFTYSGTLSTDIRCASDLTSGKYVAGTSMTTGCQHEGTYTGQAGTFQYAGDSANTGTNDITAVT